MVRLVACGGYWTESRRHNCALAPDATCQRCHISDETSLHRFWGCVCNVGEATDATQHLRHEAISQAESCPIFWFRGLVPVEMFGRPRLPIVATSVSTRLKLFPFLEGFMEPMGLEGPTAPSLC